MPGYISEISYKNSVADDFVEIAVPKNTDISGYTIQIYDASGTLSDTYSLGSITQTVDQKDVYVVDDGTAGFKNIGTTEAVALVDDLGNVVQFVSFGTNVTATNGDANGDTSTDIGTSKIGESLQSDDAGGSYFVQTSPNSVDRNPKRSARS